MINWEVVLAVTLTLFFLSLAGIPLFRQYAFAQKIVDVPNIRSFHEGIVPRGGGSVFVLLWGLAVLILSIGGWIPKELWLLFLPPPLLMATLGFWDDVKSLPEKKRLAIQILIAVFCLVLLGGIAGLHATKFRFVPLGGYLGIFIGILGFVWSTNLFNFMDGLDGLAGMEALFVFIVGGCFFALEGAYPLALLAWMMAASVAGFLVWNWPKARIFMGDAGSYALGFLIALFSVVGDLWYDIPISLWLILYGVFWFDTTVTLIRRVWLKKDWKKAHRDHAYHRLNLAGFSHAKVLWGITGLNTLLAMIAFYAYLVPKFLTAGFFTAVALLAGIYYAIERIKPLTKE